MENYEALKEWHEKMMDAFWEFDQLLRQMDRHLWERWKAGGKCVSEEFVSMYPNATEALECVEMDIPDDADENDDEANSSS